MRHEKKRRRENLVSLFLLSSFFLHFPPGRLNSFSLSEEKLGPAFFLPAARLPSLAPRPVIQEKEAGRKELDKASPPPPGILLRASGERAPEAKERKQEEEEALLKPGFTNVREQVGGYVFVFWMWLVIIVGLYILSEKIKEADRGHRMRL